MTPPQPPAPNRQPPQPSVGPTSLATLAVAALAAAALAWLGISRFYSDLPQMPWLPPLTLAGLGVVEAITAVSTKARIDRRKGTAPINPLLVARYVALAKASALAGSIFAGAYAGVLLWLVSERDRNEYFDNDFPQTVVGVLGSSALVVAALWLERSCRVPPPPENERRPEGDWIDEGRNGGD